MSCQRFFREKYFRFGKQHLRSSSDNSDSYAPSSGCIDGLLVIACSYNKGDHHD